MKGLRFVVGEVSVLEHDTLNVDILDGEILDLYPDENIELVMKQKDIIDIAGNFSDYTKDFDVPATDNNNKIFKFWYDIRNENQLNDYRKIHCRIDIDGVFFKKGFIKILEASTDSLGRIKKYSIQFYSDLKSVKDRMGDDLLSDLDISSVSDFIYDDVNVRDRIENPSYNYIDNKNHFLNIPLISTERFLNNYSEISGDNGFLNKTELRPAINVKYLFTCIENKYNIKFNGHFYDTDSSLDKLYLWLNKNENVVSKLNPIGIIKLGPGSTESDDSIHTHINYWDGEPTDEAKKKSFVFNERVLFNGNLYGGLRFIRLILQVPTNNTVKFKIHAQRLIMKSDGITIDEELTETQENRGFISQSSFVDGSEDTSGYWKSKFEIFMTDNDEKFYYRFFVESLGDLVVTRYNVKSFSNGPHEVIYYDQWHNSDYYVVNHEATSEVWNTQGFTQSVLFETKNNIPDMKVIDFMQSILKMFNLIILPVNTKKELIENVNNYILEYYDYYYNLNGELNIDKLDLNYRIKSMSNYNKILFKHENSVYGTNILYNQRQSPVRDYGSILYNSTSSDSGEYKVETKFNLLIWNVLKEDVDIEDIDDLDDSSLNNNWVVSNSLDSTFMKNVFNKPTIFFKSGYSEINERPINLGGTSSNINNYHIFSNVDYLDSFLYNTSITFSKENFVQGIEGFETDRNLYSTNYKKMISAIFNNKSRVYEYTGILPKYIITSLNLGTRIIIGNNKYIINDITLNLNNGYTKMVLSNIIDNGFDDELIRDFFIIKVVNDGFDSEYSQKTINIKYTEKVKKIDYRIRYNVYSTNPVEAVKVSTAQGLQWNNTLQDPLNTPGDFYTEYFDLLPVGNNVYDSSTGYSTPINIIMRKREYTNLEIKIRAYDTYGNILQQETISF